MTISGLTVRLLTFDATPRYNGRPVPPGRPGRYTYPLVTLRTAEGLEGHSMAYGPHGDAEALAHLLCAVYFPLLRGEDAWHSEALWQKLWRAQRHLYNQADTLPGVLDVALWDLKGKAAGRPIAKLLGLHRTRVPAYASARSVDYAPDAFAEEAQRLRAAGYHGYKLQVRQGPDHDIPCLRAAREAVGDGFPLMHDPNGAYTYPEALRVGRVLEELEYAWFEEPVNEHHLHLLARLRRELRVPILAPERTRLDDLASHLLQGTFTMARADVLLKGGITGLRKAMHACELFGYALEIHAANAPLLDVANLHVAAAAANTAYAESHHPVFRFGLKNSPLEIDGEGYLHVPDAPGLGVELDEGWVEAHTTAVHEAP